MATAFHRTASRLQYMIQSAEIGFIDGMYNLATFYQRGIGTPVDYDKSVAWFRKGAGNQ